MRFLLGVTHNDDGTTSVTYDDGPTRRVTMLTLTENAHQALNYSADDLLSYTLTEVRGPVQPRRPH